MFSEVRRRAKKAGQPPGTPIYTGTKKDVPTSVTILTYNMEECREVVATTWEACHAALENTLGMTWVNVEGLHDIALIEELAKHYQLHPLTVEDILNVEQRPKVEEFEGYLFITIKVLHLRKRATFTTQQLSIVLEKDFVLSFQEMDTTRFDPLRTKLKSAPHNRIREQGGDYLVYRLMDYVVDEYFVVLEALGDQIEIVEDRIILSATQQNAATIYRLKRQLLILRKAIWPMREAVSHLLHVDDQLINKSTRLYFRDVYDHTVQAIDTVETFRDMLSSLLDMYLSSLTNRMNEIMKTLTIITTVFIPITAIASIYGMNFTHIPGLTWIWSFPTVILVMILLAIFMMVYFRLRKWI